MSSLFESSEHQKLHDTRQSLQQDARTEWNSGFKSTTWRVAELIGVSCDKKKAIDTT